LTVAASLFLPTWEAQRFVLFYLAPLVPAVVLCARERLADRADYSRTALVLDCSVFVLAATRTVSGVLPFSGHMLFLTYALLTVRSAALRLFVGVLWLETAYFKLVLWDDPLSWSVGLLLGAVLGLVFRSRV
jgi:hypothetical protein